MSNFVNSIFSHCNKDLLKYAKADGVFPAAEVEGDASPADEDEQRNNADDDPDLATVEEWLSWKYYSCDSEYV